MADFYSRAAANNPEPSLEGGASGYFSAPSQELDPALFDGDQFRTEVSGWLWETLFSALENYHLTGVNRWLHAWVAGSAITYQWDADRGNGDLDVLFGVDYPALLRWNPEFQGLSEEQFASYLDDWLKTNVWPETAAHEFNGKTFEVTFYLNPGTGIDIRRIHPYAALDIRSGEWVVRPPVVPEDPASAYPKAWFDAAQRDADSTAALLQHYDTFRKVIGVPNSAADVNRATRFRGVVDSARALLDEIHGGRREAFGQQGTGYSDFHNFRWQAAKRSGVVQALHTVAQVGYEAREAEDTELYGGQISGASEALARAAMVHNRRKDL